MIRRRPLALTVVGVCISAVRLGVGLGLIPGWSSAAPVSSSQQSPASGATDSVAHLQVTSQRGSGYKLLSDSTPQVFQPARVDNCGSSFVSADATAPDHAGNYQEKTGFSGASPGAVSFSWSERVVVSHGDLVVDYYRLRQSGALAGQSGWTAQHTGSTDGPANFTVDVNGTWLLADGQACQAEGTVWGTVP
jgi:hypothetical protein